MLSWFVSEQLDVIKQLDANCTNTKVKLDADDIKIAPIVAGLSSMFSTICSDPKTFNGKFHQYNLPCATLKSLPYV
jgi:hypothetical protein